MEEDLAEVLKVQLRRGRHDSADAVWNKAHEIAYRLFAGGETLGNEALKGVAMGIHVLAHEQLASAPCDSARGWSSTRVTELRRRVDESGGGRSVAEIAAVLLHDNLARGGVMKVSEAFKYAVMLSR